MTRSRSTATAIGGVLLLLLAGCGGGPVLAGAAATVGDTRIATTDLAALVDRALADPQAQQQLGADRESFQRASLSRLITHDLLVAAAAREGVRVLPGQVDARLAELEQQSGGAERLVQRAAENGVPEQDLRPFVSDLVLTDALGDALTADVPVPQARLEAAYQGSAQYDQVHAAHILVRTRAQAESIRRQLAADPGRFAELAKRFSIDTSNKDTGGDLGFAGRGTFVPAFERAIFAAKQGDLIVVQTEFGFHVVRILERRTTTLAEATPQLRRMILQQERTERVGALLRDVAADLGVRVSPRFGRWDSTAGAVVPVGSGVGGVSSPAPPPPGAGLAPGGQPGAPGGGQPADPGAPQGEPPAPPAP